MHWLVPYVIHFIIERGAVQLQQLDGVFLSKLVNGSQLNPYQDTKVQQQC